VRAMPGGTYLHATIIANAAGELHQALRQRPCTVTAIDLRLRLSHWPAHLSRYYGGLWRGVPLRELGLPNPCIGRLPESHAQRRASLTSSQNGNAHPVQVGIHRPCSSRGLCLGESFSTESQPSKTFVIEWYFLRRLESSEKFRYPRFARTPQKQKHLESSQVFHNLLK